MFKGSDYKVRMEITEDKDAGTATIQCFVDKKLMAWYTDPCPLKTGEFGMKVYRNTAAFAITSFTDRACNSVPVEAKLPPSLADGLTLSGAGRTAGFWKSVGQSKVTHMYQGSCNNVGGKNRFNHPSDRNTAHNYASLATKTCVKDGFFDADVTLKYDFLNSGHSTRGEAGVAMRVQGEGPGYTCTLSMSNGKVTIRRGGKNKRTIGGAYLYGRYRCPECTCKGTAAACKQFNFAAEKDSNGKTPFVLRVGDAHRMRIEMATTAAGYPHVKCYINGTKVQDAIDQPHPRYKRFLGSPITDMNKKCGNFGITTVDQDVVTYKINGYTGKKA